MQPLGAPTPSSRTPLIAPKPCSVHSRSALRTSTVMRSGSATSASVSASAQTARPAGEAAMGPMDTTHDANVTGTAGAVVLQKERTQRAEVIRNIVFVSSEVRRCTHHAWHACITYLHPAWGPHPASRAHHITMPRGEGGHLRDTVPTHSVLCACILGAL